MDIKWQERSRPIRLERRYEFKSYHELSDFLDAAAEVSEREGLYPDMGFGKDYVNITIHVEDGESELGELHHRLATEFDSILDNATH